jgi:hypothetical protein
MVLHKEEKVLLTFSTPAVVDLADAIDGTAGGRLGERDRSTHAGEPWPTGLAQPARWVGSERGAAPNVESGCRRSTKKGREVPARDRREKAEHDPCVEDGSGLLAELVLRVYDGEKTVDAE